MTIKLGLIADTHMPGTLESLWPEALRVFEGAEVILHAGDLHTLDIVNHLETIAPTYVARGNGDVGIHDARLQDTWLLPFDGIQIGMIHQFPSPIRKKPEQLQKHLLKQFPDRQPDVLIYGHTHLEDVRSVEGRLYVNPGSPTLPRNQSLRRGTLATIEIADQITVDIHQITETGTEIVTSHAADKSP